jgi:hypothetical protein
MPTYTYTKDKSTIVEGETVTYSVVTTDFGTGVLYWTNAGTTVAADFSDNLNSGSITITNNVGTLTRTAAVDIVSDAGETLIVQLRTISTSGTIVFEGSTVTVNDYITINGIEVEVRSATHMQLERIKNDPFKGPDKTKVLRLLYKNYVEIIPASDCTVLKYVYRYIKKPTPVNVSTGVTFSLSEHTHQEIVDEAIKIALEGIEGKRNQTFTPIIDNQKE